MVSHSSTHDGVQFRSSREDLVDQVIFVHEDAKRSVTVEVLLPLFHRLHACPGNEVLEFLPADRLEAYIR